MILIIRLNCLMLLKTPSLTEKADVVDVDVADVVVAAVGVGVAGPEVPPSGLLRRLAEVGGREMDWTHLGTMTFII